MTPPEITQQQVQDLFDYDPLTGALTHKSDAPPRGKAGAVVGWIHPVSGYRKLSIAGHEYSAHVVIWLWMTGALNVIDIDHKDRVRSNNIWVNLRKATRSQNLTNQGKKFNNTSGYKGVCSRGNSHMVQFRVGGVLKRFGSYPTALEAAQVYDREAVKHLGAFAKTNKALGLI